MPMTAMDGSDQTRLRAALLAAMRPLAAVLLRFGIGYREFAEVLKAAFVDAATAEFGVRGRPTNVSRVAAMTGLPRKEVRRLRAAPPDAMESGPGTLPAEVLHRWYTDPRYASGPGRPRDLPYDGSDGSFSALVRDCAGDIPPGAVRAELRRLGVVSDAAMAQLRPTRRYVVPASGVDALLEGLTTGLRTVAMTIGWNAGAADGELRRFQRAVSNRTVPVQRHRDVELQLRSRLTAWTEEVDDFLGDLEQQSLAGDDEAAAGIRVGVGMYYFEEPSPGPGPGPGP